MRKTGLQLITEERNAQRVRWSEVHDDSHVYGELSMAAAAYAQVASAQMRGASAEEFTADMMIGEGDWPFEADAWKPREAIDNLVRAGALIAAEIDRIQRAAGPDSVCEHGTALDVHCCNCHGGFLFDASSCVCLFTMPQGARGAGQ